MSHWPIERRHHTLVDSAEEDAQELAAILKCVAGCLMKLRRFTQCAATWDILAALPVTDKVECWSEKAICVRLLGDTATSNQLLAQCLAEMDRRAGNVDVKLNEKRQLLLDYQKRVSEFGREVTMSDANRELRRMLNTDLESQKKSLKQIVPDTTEVHVDLREMQSERKGRGMFATAHIPYDTIVMRERPVACLLRDNLHAELCTGCAVDLLSTETVTLPLPCSDCTHALYCSVSCRDQSWRRFHWIECGQERWLQQTASARLSLRMLGSNDEWRQVLHGSERSLSVSTLTTHSDRFTSEVVGRQTLAAHLFACFFLRHLDRHPAWPPELDMNENWNALESLDSFASAHSNPSSTSAPASLPSSSCSIEDQTSQIEQRLTEILLNNLQQVAINSIAVYRPIVQLSGSVTSIAEANGDKKAATSTSDQPLLLLERTAQQVALAIYQNASLLNHSCAPNAELFTFIGSELIIRTRSRIRAGQELTISYGPTVQKTPTRARRAALLHTHQFRCKCEHCAWPVGSLTDTQRRYLLLDAYLCPTCSHPILVDTDRQAARCLAPTKCQHDHCSDFDSVLIRVQMAQREWLRISSSLSGDANATEEENALKSLQRLLWPTNRLLMAITGQAIDRATRTGQWKSASELLHRLETNERSIHGERSVQVIVRRLQLLLIECRQLAEKQLINGRQLGRALRQANAAWRQIAAGADRPANPVSDLLCVRMPASLKDQLKQAFDDMWKVIADQHVLMASLNAPLSGCLLLDSGGPINQCLLLYRQLIRYLTVD